MSSALIINYANHENRVESKEKNSSIHFIVLIHPEENLYSTENPTDNPAHDFHHLSTGQFKVIIGVSEK